MLFLPIIERELRIAAKNWRTYYSRTGLGLVALCGLIYLLWLLQGAGAGPGLGVNILRGVSMAVFALCLFNGVNRTADCISSEKRADTLGFLFLTHLKGYDVVLGKLFAHSMEILFLVLAILPIMGVPMMLGGVSGGQLWRVVIALLNALLFGGAVGMLVSTLVRKQRGAYSAATGIVVLVAFIFPACAVLAQRYSSIPWLPMVLQLPSPAYALAMGFDFSFGLSTNYFWAAIGLQFAVSVGALSLASLLVPHCWQMKPSKSATWRERVSQFALGNAKQRTRRRRRMLDRNPIYWLSNRERFVAWGPIIFALVTFSVAGFFVWRYDLGGEEAMIVLVAAFAINDFSMRIRVASAATARLAGDRQNGALEMILSTPITVREIVRGTWMGIRHRLLWTFVPLVLLLAGGGMALVSLGEGRISVVLFFVVLSVGDFITTGYVGMWTAMRVKKVQEAAGTAVARVMFAPWVVWMLTMPIIYEVEPFKRWIDADDNGVLIWAAIIWVTSSVLAYRSARRNLRLHFREAATDRYNFDRRSGFWERLWNWRLRLFPFNLLRWQGRVLN
jgi:ABC-type transport system involved in multi-copper enzyme maturation permease subunit